MVNRSQKEQILKQLERHYISPLSQFYLETEVLKRIMLGRPLRVQIGVPDSWRFQHFYQKMAKVTQEEALARLWCFDRYLEGSNASVFSHDKPLVLGDSFPYFEWQDGEKTYGLNRLLGHSQIFYFYKGNEEVLEQFCEFIVNKPLATSAIIVGILPEPLLNMVINKGLTHISEISKPFSETLGKGRSFTNLFSQSADLLLMDQNGHYVKGLTRAEFVRQIDQIVENHFS